MKLRLPLAPAFVWKVIGPFLGVVALLAALGLLSAQVLSGVRAFVGGESLWSKGQKDAVYHLGLYVQSHDEADYAQVRAALAIPLGDRQARLELDRPDPDLASVRAGFLAGGNHPQDIDSLIWLYRYFRRVSFMADAIAIWAEGDAAIAELNALVERTHASVSTAQADSAALAEALAPLPALNQRLTLLEQRFSATLGEASRTTQSLLNICTLLLASMLAVVGTALTIRVLSAQARTEQALRDANERWEMAGAGAGIGVFDWDLERREVMLDVRAAALYGLAQQQPASFSTRFTTRALYAEDLPRVRTALKQAVAAGQPIDCRFRVRWPDGTLRHLELNGRVSSRGRRRMVGVLWDVTDDVQAEQLRLDKETAERGSRAKTAFLSRVSHELRTPLNAILGFAQLLQTDPADPLTPGQAARIVHVLASGEQLLGLINDVLDLTSLDQDAFAVTAREIDLARLLRQSVARFEPFARSRDVALAMASAVDEAPVLADPLRLDQVFSNLISNAIKYNRAGGRVDVRLDAEAEECFAFHVQDTGRGLDAAQQAQLFQPFNRLGAEYSSVPGSGLGLVITRQLVERMGGTLSLASEPGRGSAFSVRLRRSRSGPVVEAREAPAAALG